MKIIICGGRDFTDHLFLFKEMDALHAARPVTLVIEGGQRTRCKEKGYQIVGGADYWGMRWAKRVGIPFVTVRAEWNKYGPEAGPIRNKQMLDEHTPDEVHSFPGGDGTADMIDRALSNGYKVIQHRPEIQPIKKPPGGGFFS